MRPVLPAQPRAAQRYQEAGPKERGVAELLRYPELAGDVAEFAGRAESGKATVRRMFGNIQAREQFVAEHGECERNGGSRVERVG